MLNLVISAIAGTVPTTDDLSVDEIGVNTADSKIFFNNGSEIITLPVMDVINGVASLPVNGDNGKAISSNWAYDHAADSRAHPRDTRNQIAGNYNAVIGTDTDVNTSGAQVIDVLSLTDGVVVGHTKRTLTAAIIGALGANDSAVNAEKLGNQLPSYYGKQSDIDALNNIVFSDDGTLNKVQEIVDYIKLNRSDLDALSIASIAGLVAALAGKSDTGHGHALADITGLVTALAGKSGTGHGHSLASLGYTGASDANKYILPSSVVHQNEREALHGSDALRISGLRLYLYKGDGTYEYVDIPNTNVDTNTWRSISNSVSSTSSSISASLAAVKTAYDKANHSHPYAASSHTHAVTRTTLLNSASGITSGNLSLSGWQNYDMLEVVGVDANDNRATTNFHTPSSLIQGLSSASDGKYVLWDNGSGAHWWVKGYTSSSLTYDSDNARILRIVGIKFTA